MLISFYLENIISHEELRKWGEIYIEEGDIWETKI